VYKFKTDDAGNNEKDRDKPDNMIRITKKENPAGDRPCSANSRPNGVSSADRDSFHGLGDGKKTQDNKDEGNDAGNYPGKTLRVFEGNGKTDLKKSCQKKKDPSERHTFFIEEDGLKGKMGKFSLIW